MGAVASKTVADLRRRRLQTIVLAIVLFLGAGAATLALSILVETNEPFEHAFAAANGAHLVVDYDAGRSSDAAARGDGDRERRHRQRRSVAGRASPSVAGKGDLIGNLVVSGRPTPDDTIDHVTISAGRWWQAPGEIVLDQDTAALLDIGLGARVPLYVQPDVRGQGAEPAAPGGTGPARRPGRARPDPPTRR